MSQRIRPTDDRTWMQHAIDLARRGEGGTRPNPPVGAIVVRGNTTVGSGYHRKAGGPHAEVFALAAAGDKARGATLYVTLEPCSTWGRTPPCTDAILRSGIKRVVIGTKDPTSANGGKATRILKKDGIAVTDGVLRKECDALVAPFVKLAKCGRPYVTLKLAMSVDGRIADFEGCSRWITGPEARDLVHEMRRRSDAVMVGGTTARIDNPSLMPKQGSRQLFRIVVDSTGDLQLGAKMLNDGTANQTIIATTAKCSKKTKNAFRSKGADVWRLRQAGKHVSIADLLDRAGGKGFLRLLCEGGGALAADLIRRNLVDEYVFFVAPCIIGGDGRPSVAGKGWHLDQVPGLRFTECFTVGKDVMLKAVPAGAHTQSKKVGK